MSHETAKSVMKLGGESIERESAWRLIHSLTLQRTKWRFKTFRGYVLTDIPAIPGNYCITLMQKLK